MAQRTTSTHRSSLVRGTYLFHIVGYSTGVASSARSSSFHAGGHDWAVVCGFGDHDQLQSISLDLLSTGIAEDVIAMASLRMDDPHGQRPPAVWRSDEANVFPAWPTASAMATCRSWKLSLPDAFRGQESSYVKDDGLMIQCTIDVLVDHDSTATAPERIVSVVPPPTISQDLHKLLLILQESSSEPETMKPCLIPPDVTFVVEDITEIKAHKLVLAMRSSVFAAELFHSRDKKEDTRGLKQVVDMSASTFRAILRFIYTDELPISKPSNKMITFTGRACKEKYAARRRAAMARDLLVAAQRYDLHKLSLMCQEILSDNSDAVPTFTIDRSCDEQLIETSCIDYYTTTTTTTTSSPNTGSAEGAPIMVQSPSIITHLEKLLVKKEWSDVMFLVEGSQIYAHRLLIAARSPVLHEKVVVASAANDNIVRIDAMKAAIFKVILHFIYTDELPPMDDLLIASAGDLATVVAGDMLVAACRFRLERMKAMCENLLAECVSTDTVFSVLKLACTYHCTELKDYCTDFISLPRNTKDVIKSICLA